MGLADNNNDNHNDKKKKLGLVKAGVIELSPLSRPPAKMATMYAHIYLSVFSFFKR
jgi:hypothetical protein